MDTKNPGPSRNRKRPQYLQDFYENGTQKSANSSDNESLEENNVKFKTNATDACGLCGSELVSSSYRWNFTKTTGASKLSYAEVLNNFLGETNQNTNNTSVYFDGFLCFKCKNSVLELDLLQQKIVGVKMSILHKMKKKKEKHPSKTNSEYHKIKEEVFTDKFKKARQSFGMTDVERAKLRNLPAEHKIQVKKHSRTGVVFIIESLKEKKGGKYLVKWENYPEDESTWESRSTIPAKILQVNLHFYTYITNNFFSVL